MKTVFTFILSFFLFAFESQGSVDTICYYPEKKAVYKNGNIVLSKTLYRLADSLGLFKTSFERQHVKLYLVINDKGKVLNVLNGGCVIDPSIEGILISMFMNAGEFEPATNKGTSVSSALLFEFDISPLINAEFDVRVKLNEIAISEEKDFSRFINMYSKWIDEKTYYPKKYKPNKLDGLVTIEFSFNLKGKPTKFNIIKNDKEEFLQSALITLFMVKPIPADYLNMIGFEKRFTVTFDFVAFSDLDGFLPSNH